METARFVVCHFLTSLFCLVLVQGSVKDLVDGAPSKIKEAVAKEAAEEMEKKFKEAGAETELK